MSQTPVLVELDDAAPDFDDLVDAVITRILAGERVTLTEYVVMPTQNITRLGRLLPIIRALSRMAQEGGLWQFFVPGVNEFER